MNTQARELGPYEPVPDELVLAAIERAARHGADPVWTATVGDHLGFENTSHNSRRLRARLEHLRVRERCVERHDRHGRDYWSLTLTGSGWLEALREEGKLRELPESPQHRDWREAREAARRRIDEFELLATGLFDDGFTDLRFFADRADSRAWLRMSERLAAALWLLGSATYCLEEWPEPDDSRADIDEDPGPPPGRRAISAWKDKEATAKGAER